jgi:predicted ferric reductase
MLGVYRFLLFFLFSLNLFVIVGFWFLGSGALIGAGMSDNFLAFGRLYGLLAVFFALCQFILMGRTVWIERAFGLDRLSRVHRINGYFTFVFILLHVICILIAYSLRSGYSLIDQFIRFVLYYDDLWQAVVSFLLFSLVVGLSIAIARRRFRYEVWYAVHLTTYLAIVLAFGHQLELGGDFSHDLFVMYWYGLYAFVAVNVLLFRFLVPAYRFFFHRFVVDRLVSETHDSTSVYISGRFLSRLSVLPGQFFIFRFLRRKIKIGREKNI